MVTHQFAAGTYPVTLTVKDPANRAVSTTRTITVRVGVDADGVVRRVARARRSPGQTVFFNAAASTAPGTRTIVDYQWNFGDGTTGRGVTTSHAFAVAGHLHGHADRRGRRRADGHRDAVVTVGTTGPAAPIAKFLYSPTSPVHGVAVNFSGADSTSSAVIDSLQVGLRRRHHRVRQ